MSDQPNTELLDRKIPVLNQSQLNRFECENIHVANIGNFVPVESLVSLKQQAKTKVIGIDIGGDKSLVQLYSINKNGNLLPDNSYKDLEKDRDGTGYVASLKKAAEFAQNQNIPVGLSIGLTLNGSIPSKENGHKLPIFRKELLEKYSGDLSNIFSTKLTCLNDGPAGLISGAVQANISLDSQVNDVIYVINGGGIGAAVLKNNEIFATEAGHVPVEESLNLYNEKRNCKHFDKPYVCLENVASNKKGIEEIWQRKTGQNLNALEIEKRFTQNQENGSLALELYDYSAYMLAHLIKGLSNTFDIDLKASSSAVVCHGGAFKFPDYGKRIQQILEANGDKTEMILTKDYSDNACAEGAAIAALTMK